MNSDYAVWTEEAELREDIRECAQEEGKKREIAACIQKERFLNKQL